MDKKFIPNIVLEGVKIKHRNLRGEPNDYNRAGDRNFSVILPSEELALQLKEDGWNVKSWTNDKGETEWTLPVTVAFKTSRGEDVRRPPRIYILADGVKTEQDQEMLNDGSVDYADIHHVDLTIRPYAWETKNGSGIKAYLKNMYVTVNVDKLDRKFEHYGAEEPANDDDPEKLPF